MGSYIAREKASLPREGFIPNSELTLLDHVSKVMRLEVLGSLAQADVLRCCIESTGAYHMPVLRAWKAIPCVVNPLLAPLPAARLT